MERGQLLDMAAANTYAHYSNSNKATHQDKRSSHQLVDESTSQVVKGALSNGSVKPLFPGWRNEGLELVERGKRKNQKKGDPQAKLKFQ